MKYVTVYCGSAIGLNPAFVEGARRLGEAAARRGIGVVYGGSRIGLMGALADEALRHGGEVVGVIPEGLRDAEVEHPGLSRTEVVATMHERKARMVDLADAFVVLPGGIGTMDEFFETWTWGHLGLHVRPIGVLNTAGYFDSLVRFVDEMLSQGFVGQAARDRVVVETDPIRLLDRLATARVDAGTRWKGGRITR